MITEGLTYDFRIRNDAFWHDGEPVTAQDVVYTYGLIQDADYPGRKDLAELWRSVKVKALSAKEVRFTLSEPYAPFLDYLTTGLLPFHVLSGTGVKELDTLPFQPEADRHRPVQGGNRDRRGRNDPRRHAAPVR